MVYKYLDGNSEHLAHLWRKICLVEKNIQFVTALAPSKCLNYSNNRDCSKRAHLFLSKGSRKKSYSTSGPLRPFPPPFSSFVVIGTFFRATVCPRSSDLFYVVTYYVKTGHYFLDTKKFTFSYASTRSLGPFYLVCNYAWNRSRLRGHTVYLVLYLHHADTCALFFKETN